MDFKVAAIVGLAAACLPASAKDSHTRSPPAKTTHVAALANAVGAGADRTGSVVHRRASRVLPQRKGTEAALATADGTSLAAPPGFSADDVGWRLIEDSATGARLGVPDKLVPRAGASQTGSRWSSAQGQIQIETFRLSEAALPALFDQEKKTSRRAIAASELKADSFIITGTQGLKNFLMRAQAHGTEVRGVTILYDQATEGIMARVAAAVANTFIGFPDPNEGLPPGVKRAVEYGTAIVVGADGDLIAPAHLTDECRAITVPPLGHAERVAADAANDLALLRIYGARNLVVAPLGTGAGQTGDVALVGVADPLTQAGADEVTSTAARITAQGLEPAPKPGYAGAAAVDTGGNVAGMVDLKPAVVAGGSVAQAPTLVPAAAIRAFLDSQGVAPGAALAEHAAIGQTVMRVICVHK